MERMRYGLSDRDIVPTLFGGEKYPGHYVFDQKYNGVDLNKVPNNTVVGYAPPVSEIDPGQILRVINGVIIGSTK